MGVESTGTSGGGFWLWQNRQSAIGRSPNPDEANPIRKRSTKRPNPVPLASGRGRPGRGPAGASQRGQWHSPTGQQRLITYFYRTQEDFKPSFGCSISLQFFWILPSFSGYEGLVFINLGWRSEEKNETNNGQNSCPDIFRYICVTFSFFFFFCLDAF